MRSLDRKIMSGRTCHPFANSLVRLLWLLAFTGAACAGVLLGRFILRLIT